MRLDLFEDASDDYGFALLGLTITDAVSRSALSDDDAYPLLVRYWNGSWPEVDWPAHAPAVARRCATALAEHGTCEMETFMHAPTDASLRRSRSAVITELELTRTGLLEALADHWERVADLEMPIEGGCSLLAFARQVLLEPLVGASALIWSTLDAATSVTGAEATIDWAEWSPVMSDDWSGDVAAEMALLGRPTPQLPAGADECAEVLACARAMSLGVRGGAALVATSIVRTSGWPGETDIIDPIAARAVECAMDRVDDVDPESDNEQFVEVIQRRLLPLDEALIGWVRDPSFGTLSDHAGSSRTGAEMLHAVADWLTWSIANEAVEAAAATRRPPRLMA